MLGFIKKDMFMIKSNLKTIIIILAVFLVMMLQGTLDIIFVMPIIGTMLFIGTFSYDDFNHWNAFAIALPNGRKNIVKAKYIASFILTFILGMVSFLLSLIVNLVSKNGIHLEEMITSLLGTILSIVIMISLLYPIVFRFGAINGRTILFVMVFGIAGVFTLIANFIDMTAINQVLNSLENMFYITVPILSILLLGISYLIANRIYQRKEF